MENPSPNLVNQADFLGEWDEVVGRHQAPGRVAPPDKSFKPANGVCFQVDQWLVVNLEVVFCERPAQIELQGTALLYFRVHAVLEEAARAAPSRFGAIER